MSDFASRNAGFIYRVAGVCLHEGHVLLHRGEFEEMWSLPGGRAEFRETSSSALEREMWEEIGVGVAVGRLLWVMENFFVHAGRQFHELGFYYEMAFPASSGFLDVEREFTGIEGEARLIFRWFPTSDLTSTRLYPIFLRTALAHPPASLQHVVEIDPDDEVSTD